MANNNNTRMLDKANTCSDRKTAISAPSALKKPIWNGRSTMISVGGVVSAGASTTVLLDSLVDSCVLRSGSAPSPELVAVRGEDSAATRRRNHPESRPLAFRTRPR